MIHIVNARAWTGVDDQPWAEAVATNGERIAVVGTREQVRAAGRPDHEIDAGGALLTPGLIDAHLHLIAGGLRLSAVVLGGAVSRAEVESRVRDFAARRPAGTWIIGGDWDHYSWGGELPSREWLDVAASDHPVWLTRVDGHMAVANSLALRLAGVDRRTLDVSGGTIDRDAAGEPTGLFRDNAMLLVERAIPPLSLAQLDTALADAMRYLASHGVTCVHHMGSLPPGTSWEELDVFRRARDRDALTVRIRATVPLETWPRLRDTIASRDLAGDDGRGDDWLRVGMLKTFMDGSLGSHTAAFHEPYTDAPGDCGLLLHDRDALCRLMSEADAAGLQLATHAIGDRANTVLLDVLEAVARINGPRDRRCRVEHAQHLRPSDIARFGRLDAIASMQPYHAIDDGRWAETAIGRERAQASFAWRALRDAGATLAFGSDWFVAPANPIDGLYAAVTRRTLDGRHPDGWVPAQRIDLDDALHGYTTGAAFAAFDEDRLGRIAPGALADIVVFDRDLFATPPADLRDARVTATIVNGTIVYDARR